MRQVAQYAETSGELYPRLLVVEFMKISPESETDGKGCFGPWNLVKSLILVCILLS